jgi:hypothetical protein
MMEVTGWDQKAFHITHSFVVADRVVAEGTSQGVIIGKTGVTPPSIVMEELTRQLGQKNA